MDPRNVALRLVLFAILVLGLVSLFAFHGTLEPTPERHDYPDTTHFVADPDAYVGEQVDVAGVVVETEPVVLEFPTGDRYVVENAPAADVGQQLAVFATVEAAGGTETDGGIADDGQLEAAEVAADNQLEVDGRLEAHDGVARDQWEVTYMYAVSIVAAVWVLGRAFRHWRIDVRRIGVVPRAASTDPGVADESTNSSDSDG